MATKKPEQPYPWKPWRVPAELMHLENGRLPQDLLRQIRGGGQLWTKAARDWNQMCRAMKRDGIEIQSVSRGYRSYSIQLAMWVDRWQRRPSNRKPMVTKVWQQEMWYLKAGKSPSAVPGTSPHGWGCAQDINHHNKKLFNWMCHNAPKYNYWLQADKDSKYREDWHWHWLAPDVE